MKLLYRGIKQNDEFLTDYIRRISDKNGFSCVTKFRQNLIKFFKYQAVKNHSLSDHAVARVSLELILKRNIPIDEYRRFCNRKRNEWHKHLRICRSCWAQEDYIRFYWWLTPYEKCHLHNEMLVFTNSESQSFDFDGDWGSYSQVVYLIVAEHTGSERCQTLILNELSRSEYDLKLIKGIEQFFGFNGRVKFAVEKLKEIWKSGYFVGKAIEQRILYFSRVMAKYIGEDIFWLRIIALSVFANNRGLYLGIYYSEIGHEYSRFCHYLLSTDAVFINYLQGLKGIKKYVDMEGISIDEFLCSEIEMPYDLVIRIKSSFFWCRRMGDCVPNRYPNKSVVDLLPTYRDSIGTREF